LHQSLWEDLSDLLKVAYQEALLIHVVAVMRLYIVLVHLLPYYSEMLSIQSLRVSLVPCKVNSVEISAVQDTLVSGFEASRPVLARL